MNSKCRGFARSAEPFGDTPTLEALWAILSKATQFPLTQSHLC